MEALRNIRKRLRVDIIVPLLRNSLVMIQSTRIDGLFSAHTM